MLEVVLYSALVIFVLAILAIAHKYHIDTSSTIAELSKDRKLYQRMAWQEIEARDSFLKSHTAAIADLRAKVSDSIQNLVHLKKQVNDSNLSKIEKTEIIKRLDSSLQALRVFSDPGTVPPAVSTTKAVSK